MTLTDEAVSSFHSRIFDAPTHQRLSPSFYWGLGFAILLHLALIYYLFQQNFQTPIIDSPPIEHTMGVTIETMPKKTVDTPPNHVVFHPAPTPPVTEETIPTDPQVNNSSSASVTSAPPIISTGSGGTASSSASVSGPIFVTPTWTRFPDAEALSQYYPSRAVENEREGSAQVECTVLDGAGHVSCRALSESPGGYGFGPATVRMIEAIGRIDTTKGNVKVGSALRMTVKWQLPG